MLEDLTPAAGATAPPKPAQPAPSLAHPTDAPVAPPNQMPSLQAPRRKPESETPPAQYNDEGKSAEASGLRPLGG